MRTNSSLVEDTLTSVGARTPVAIEAQSDRQRRGSRPARGASLAQAEETPRRTCMHALHERCALTHRLIAVRRRAKGVSVSISSSVWVGVFCRCLFVCFRTPFIFLLRALAPYGGGIMLAIVERMG